MRSLPRDTSARISLLRSRFGWAPRDALAGTDALLLARTPLGRRRFVVPRLSFFGDSFRQL